jgi:uncharacterized Zn-binding protein involved in type VI secretion
VGAVKLECAARIYDRVEHTRSFLGALAGFLVGLAVGIFLVAAVVSTGGLAAVALVASAALLGSSLGEFVGKFISHDAGDVKTGALTVFVGGVNRRASRVDDKLECHSGEIIVSGCQTIFVETLNAARVTEETSCGGKIKDGSGCPTVRYGGESVVVRPKRFSGELPGWFYWGREAVGLVAMVAGWRAIFKDWGKYGRWLKGYFISSTAFTVTDKALNVAQGVAHHVENTGLEDAIKSIRNHPIYKLASFGFYAVGQGRRIKLAWNQFGRGRKVYEGVASGVDGITKALDAGEAGALLLGDQNLAGKFAEIENNPWVQGTNLGIRTVGFAAGVKSQMPQPTPRASPIIIPKREIIVPQTPKLIVPETKLIVPETPKIIIPETPKIIIPETPKIIIPEHSYIPPYKPPPPGG